MEKSKASTRSGAKGGAAGKRSTSAKSTSSPKSDKLPSGKGSGKAPLSPEMVCIILENALDVTQKQFGTVKIRTASYDPGNPETLVVLPQGLFSCHTCGHFFPGNGPYCQTHSNAHPRTAISLPA